MTTPIKDSCGNHILKRPLSSHSDRRNKPSLALNILCYNIIYVTNNLITSTKEGITL